MTRYYVDAGGAYLGGFAPVIEDGVERWPEIPVGALEILAPPADGRMIRDPVTGAWSMPPAPVPASVSAFQARAALARAGLLTAVQSWVDTLPADAEMRLAWDHAQAFERASPTIASAATALGLTEAGVDDLFRTAATIVA